MLPQLSRNVAGQVNGFVNTALNSLAGSGRRPLLCQRPRKFETGDVPQEPDDTGRLAE